MKTEQQNNNSRLLLHATLKNAKIIPTENNMDALNLNNTLDLKKSNLNFTSNNNRLHIFSRTHGLCSKIDNM
jgi:hypothetical protein